MFFDNYISVENIEFNRVELVYLRYEFFYAPQLR